PAGVSRIHAGDHGPAWRGPGCHRVSAIGRRLDQTSDSRYRSHRGSREAASDAGDRPNRRGRDGAGRPSPHLAAPRTLRPSVGDRPSGWVTSYVPDADRTTPAREAAHGTEHLSVTRDDAGVLLFRDSNLQPLLRLSPERLAVAPAARLALELPG